MYGKKQLQKGMDNETIKELTDLDIDEIELIATDIFKLNSIEELEQYF
ncbi:hypothetical protein HBE96_16555 [Clostridium sp. P21]|uniref:DUF4351 domain-containing protein n=1 Tax=Clostridium muellerianum TaxID=2716538 RepID=A0A7Y0EIS7_9CLOT|nr:hypothetical protein [Clostridium muellerianum]NMM64238.1 hypothetical protein [Clostridium muellerianum]